MKDYIREAINTALNYPRDWKIALLVVLILIFIGLITGCIQKFIDRLFKTKKTIIQKNDSIPKIHLHLYGSGAKRRVEGHVEKKDDKTLILESIEIDQIKTKVERQFTRLLPLTDINFSNSLFTTKKPKIEVRIIYRTLDGKKYRLTQAMTQTSRTDGFLNISLVGVPKVSLVD